MELQFFNPWSDTTIGTNRLPHWDQPGATYFLTFRLADSLPEGRLAHWRDERDAWLGWNPQPWSANQEREYHERFSGAVERWLDEGCGDCALRQPKVRKAVAATFTKYDRDRYWHHAWVLMPNHAHLLFSIKAGVNLSALVKAWKGASSRSGRDALERKAEDAAFWQKDYFDRLVRDADHFRNCARYVLRNPGKARLSDGEYTLYLSKETRAALE